MSTSNSRIRGRHFRGVLLITVCAVVAAACTSDPHKEQRGHDAAKFNVQLAIAYMDRGDLPSAKEKLDRALTENPKDPNVHSALAIFYERTGNSSKADSEFKTALGLAPRDPDLLNNYAVYLCQKGRTDEGVRRFEEAAHNALYQTPWAAYTNAGVCLRAAKRNDDAAKNFQRALQIRPNFAEAVFQLGELQLQGGKLTDARAQIDTYLNSFDATPDLLLLGVRVSRAQGDQLAAERYARKLRLDFPDSAQAHALAELDRNPG
jgi:type IV pilus assembly protein PilF